MSAEPGDPIQLIEAWQRGYDAAMYSIPVNKEVSFDDRFAYEIGARDARRDQLQDMKDEAEDELLAEIDPQRFDRMDF